MRFKAAPSFPLSLAFSVCLAWAARRWSRTNSVTSW